MIRLAPDWEAGWIATAIALGVLAALALGAAATLDGQAGRIEEQARVVTVAIAAADPARQAARADAVLAMLRRRTDIAQVQVIDPNRARGDAGVPPDAPIAALIDATLRPHVSPLDVRRAFAGLPGIAVTDEGPALDRLAEALVRLGRASRWLAGAVLAGGALSGFAQAWGNRASIETLSRLGATRWQAGAALGWIAGRAMLLGSIAGMAIGIAAVPFIAAQAAGLDEGAMARIGMCGWLAILCVPLALSAAAAGGGGGAVLLRWRRLR